MSLVDFFLRCTIYSLVIVVLAIVINELGDKSNGENTSPPTIAVSEPRPIEYLNALPVKSPVEPSNTSGAESEPYRERLRRYETYRSKVLLKQGEAMEKERLLANVKTIQWIEKKLSGSPEDGTDALGERLAMIDFLQEGLAWQDNPARADILDAMERTLGTNNLQSGTRETKQMLVGDKMELFSVLAEQDADRAKQLLESTEDKQLKKIFQYAIKRLAIEKLKEAQ